MRMIMNMAIKMKYTDSKASKASKDSKDSKKNAKDKPGLRRTKSKNVVRRKR